MRNVLSSTKKLVAYSQRWCCNVCHDLLPPTYEVDHIDRLCDGGSNDVANLQALCPSCHRLKTMMETRNHALGGRAPKPPVRAVSAPRASPATPQRPPSVSRYFHHSHPCMDMRGLEKLTTRSV